MCITYLTTTNQMNRPQTQKKQPAMSDRYEKQKSASPFTFRERGGGPYYNEHGPYNKVNRRYDYVTPKTHQGRDGHHVQHGHHGQHAHHGHHRHHGRHGQNYYQPYPPQSRSDTARKIAKVQLSPPKPPNPPTPPTPPTKPSKERKDTVLRQLMEGVIAEADRECEKVMKHYCDDEETEFEDKISYEYEIDVGQGEVVVEERKLKALLERQMEWTRLSEGFETNTAVKSYCPACGNTWENTGALLAHLGQKADGNRKERYLKRDNSHKLVLNYITRLYPMNN